MQAVLSQELYAGIVSCVIVDEDSSVVKLQQSRFPKQIYMVVKSLPLVVTCTAVSY